MTVSIKFETLLNLKTKLYEYTRNLKKYLPENTTTAKLFGIETTFSDIIY